MYAEHVPAISASMRDSCEGFKRGALFALLSIRQPITSVPAQLDDVARTRAESVYLLSFKRAGYRYLELEGRTVWSKVREMPMDRPADAMAALMAVPGLGIVKSAFVAQLMGFDVACLDSRNVEREGREPRAYRCDGMSAKGLRRKIDAYVDDTGGKAQSYWDGWCEHVGTVYAKTPEAISEIHLAAIPDEFVPF